MAGDANAQVVWQARNPGLAAARSRIWYAKNKTRAAARGKAYRATHLAHDLARGKASRDQIYTLVVKLKAAPCSDCGKGFPPECMDFDHVLERGPKLFTIGKAYARQADKGIAEIAKCDLVCANCHRIRTKRRLHGS